MELYVDICRNWDKLKVILANAKIIQEKFAITKMQKGVKHDRRKEEKAVSKS